MIMISSFYWALASSVAVVNALSSSEWRAQSIYQVMTDRFARTDGSTTVGCSNLNDYCGGTWKGLINHLDYIQNMGFTAVWISPVVKNVEGLTADGASYHGYWAEDIYSVNSHYGSAEDLKSLSDEIHKRGMYLMADIVVNHMAYIGCGDCVDYSTFNPFNDKSDYHPFCLVDYNNQTSMEECWMGSNTVALADLKTESSNVQSMWQDWIKQLVSNYSIDGLRLDSAAEVQKTFYPDFLSAAGVYAIGEVFNNKPDYVCDYQQYIGGLMNYPQYYYITNAFSSTNGSIKDLENGISTMKSTCSDVTIMGSFIENHDNPRFPSITADISLAKNAIGFQMLADGMPVIYQGQEQHLSGGATPNQREALWTTGYPTSAALYGHIGKLNAIRRQAIKQDDAYLSYNAFPVWTDQHTIVMRKGSNDTQVIGVFNNYGSSGSASFNLPATSSGFDAGLELTEILSCQTYQTDDSGNLGLNITKGAPLVLYSTSQLPGSGLCDS